MPVCDTDSLKAYRASVYLVDDTYLPCVVFRNQNDRFELALHRFEETRNNKKLHESVGYEAVVKSFVLRGNRLADYSITKIKPSPYVLADKFIKKLWEAGETRMGSTQFVAEMQDGKRFNFNGNINYHFFQMPNGYTSSQIKEVYPHEYIKNACIFFERPYFDCYIEGL